VIRSLPARGCTSSGQLSGAVSTYSVDQQESFAEDQAVVAGQGDIEYWLAGAERDVVLLFGHELRVHEQSHLIHKEHHLVGASDFEEGRACLDWSFGHGKALLDTVGLVVLLVGADDMSASVADFGWQFVQVEVFRLLVFLGGVIPKYHKSLFLFGNDCQRVQRVFLLAGPFVDGKIVHLFGA